MLSRISRTLKCCFAMLITSSTSSVGHGRPVEYTAQGKQGGAGLCDPCAVPRSSRWVNTRAEQGDHPRVHRV